METRVGITQMRVGPPKTTSLFPDARVIPTYHPAACLRASDFFPHLVQDIGKIHLAPESTWAPPVFRVFDNPQEACRAIDELIAKAGAMVIDIEVGVDKLAFHRPEVYQFLCIGICYAKGKVAVFGEEALKSHKVQRWITKLIGHPRVRWICHNGKFDLAGLTRFARAPLYFDTMLASYVLDERAGTHSLGYLGVELLGTPDWKDVTKRYKGKDDTYSVIPRPVLYEYNAYDCSVTWDLYELYSEQLGEQDLRAVHDRLCKFSDMLIDVELNGLGVDLDYLDYLTEHYLDGLGVLEKDLLPWVANPRSPKQVKEALEEMGKNVESTDKETLELLQKSVDPESNLGQFLRLMLVHRREQKMYGTYVKGVRKRLHSGRVHPTFLLHGTTSGRLSCRNPNLQNVPRDSSIRRQFVPYDGRVYVQGDYAQAELRVIALLAHDEYLRGVFREGRDIHGEVTESFYGPGWTKEQRIRGKAIVFGTAYGREAYSIALEYGMPVREAQNWLDEYNALIPATMQWREDIKQAVFNEQADLVTPFGRHRRFWLITNDNAKDVLKEAWSFLPQSTASDINLLAGVELHRQGLFVCNLVHDSILVECKEDEAEDVSKVVAEVMERVALEHLGDYVPFVAETKIGQNWGDVS